MSIYKSKLNVMIPIIAGLLSGSVFAANDEAAGGTITFSGTVTDTTCTIIGGKDFTVVMHPGNLGQIYGNGAVGIDAAESTPFSINVIGCMGFDAASLAPQALKITLSGANVSSDNKYLRNASGSAQGIGIALTTDGSTPVVMNQAFASGVSTTSSNGGSSYDIGAAGAINFKAHYYNYGGAVITAGNVLTTVTYMFSYD